MSEAVALHAAAYERWRAVWLSEDLLSERHFDDLHTQWQFLLTLRPVTMSEVAERAAYLVGFCEHEPMEAADFSILMVSLIVVAEDCIAH